MSKIYSFDQLTDSTELLERRPPRFITWLLGFFSLVFLFFSILAYFGKMDIVSEGTAIVQGKSEVSVIRTQITGVVEDVLVVSGDEVKQGDVLVQLKNTELTYKQNQSDQIVKHLEKQKGMLEELKNSIRLKKLSFSDGVDEKIRDEYKAYEQGYKSLQNEKENEMRTLDNSKMSNEQDDVLQGLIMEKENLKRESESINKQKIKADVSEEEKEILNDKVLLLEAQKNSIEKRIEQRKIVLENERKKVETVKEGKQEEKKYKLNQYEENTIVSINQRIQSLEQSIFEKKQEFDGLNSQSETTVVKAVKDGIVQFPVMLQPGNLIDSGQEVVSIIPKSDEKKIKMLFSAQEVKGIKKGDRVQYSLQLKKMDKQVGVVTYVSTHPIFDKDSKSYMYELEATIDISNQGDLNTGMVGKASVITGEEPIWKFVLRKLDFISN
ncbi:TPA: HlyD family efflux transporter periplasmic adaptor subunit [Bacillus cereus]|uniref:HlyD family efflux transporter periplasmic adaptor subunit n=1 Tax=Bacillus cereus TaxID=1396 RepID=UPI0023E3A27C|nr:HlyD family secretion protein [Bacillus cereus]MDF3555401.1 HlyD family efflux transporter periplasmic adaptor subunit [Bacillus cereus]HDR8179184.1 HlyD family efflux transporter periplasmic adaptor subunit [Bacillus cereus]